EVDDGCDMAVAALAHLTDSLMHDLVRGRIDLDRVPTLGGVSRLPNIKTNDTITAKKTQGDRLSQKTAGTGNDNDRKTCICTTDVRESHARKHLSKSNVPLRQG